MFPPFLRRHSGNAFLLVSAVRVTAFAKGSRHTASSISSLHHQAPADISFENKPKRQVTPQQSSGRHCTPRGRRSTKSRVTDRGPHPDPHAFWNFSQAIWMVAHLQGE
ncbi:hypothetical protein TGRH88_020230 [Toxoplasma gondii]|uniref:Uncharacterized protein n=1 Tax=Toxoplasma gondii TaxID=5811 RepID=A0A7J6KIB6_TOXGO|nr:hypothetical protein TGRH88_020230 [Toxoplasma gondii]